MGRKLSLPILRCSIEVGVIQTDLGVSSVKYDTIGEVLPNNVMLATRVDVSKTK